MATVLTVYGAFEEVCVCSSMCAHLGVDVKRRHGELVIRVHCCAVLEPTRPHAAARRQRQPPTVADHHLVDNEPRARLRHAQRHGCGFAHLVTHHLRGWWKEWEV